MAIMARYGTTSRMFVAGNLTRKAERLIQITHGALYKGMRHS